VSAKTADHNLFAQEHLHSHGVLKRCEILAESVEAMVLQRHSAEPKQKMAGPGVPLL
jgi:hypothetical protein